MAAKDVMIVPKVRAVTAVVIPASLSAVRHGSPSEEVALLTASEGTSGPTESHYDQ
jgi:hypothetical protein